MLDNLTKDKLYDLGWEGFASALEKQLQTTQYEELPFLERLGFLLDQEMLCRENKKLEKALARANMRQSACIEDIDFRVKRGLNKSVVLGLATCKWLNEGHNALITGPAGVGKSFLACALGHKACIEGYAVRYYRMSAFLDELVLRRSRGTFSRFQKHLSKIPLLILDDFGLQEFSKQQRIDFLDILDDRVHRRSTMIVTQVPVEHWHGLIGDSTIADAILDRFIHNAYSFEMSGESMRKQRHGFE